MKVKYNKTTEYSLLKYIENLLSGIVLGEELKTFDSSSWLS